MGNPKDRDGWVWMPTVEKPKLKHIQALSKDAASLARNLMEYLLTPDELSESNCTPAHGRGLLSEEKLEVIHRKLYMYKLHYLFRHVPGACNED